MEWNNITGNIKECSTTHYYNARLQKDLRETNLCILYLRGNIEIV